MVHLITQVVAPQIILLDCKLLAWSWHLNLFVSLPKLGCLLAEVIVVRRHIFSFFHVSCPLDLADLQIIRKMRLVKEVFGAAEAWKSCQLGESGCLRFGEDRRHYYYFNL